MADELQKVYGLLGDVFKTEDIMNEAGGIQLCYHFTTERSKNPAHNGNYYTMYISEDADKAYNSLKELRKMTENARKAPDQKAPDQKAPDQKAPDQKGPDQTAGLKAQIIKLSGEKRKAEMKVFDLKADLKQAQETYDGLVSRVNGIIEAGNNMADELKDARKKHRDLQKSVYENFCKERGLDP